VSSLAVLAVLTNMIGNCKYTSPSAVEVKIFEIDVISQLTDIQCIVRLAHSNVCTVCDKVKLQQSLYWPIADRRGFQEVEAPRFPEIWHMKVFRLSALNNVHSYPPKCLTLPTFFRNKTIA
jgi:hypothetical protein